MSADDTITAEINGVYFQSNLVDTDPDGMYEILGEISGLRPVPLEQVNVERSAVLRFLDRLKNTTQPVPKYTPYGLHEWHATINVENNIPTIVFKNDNRWHSSSLNRRSQLVLQNIFQIHIIICTKERLCLRIRSSCCGELTIEFENPVKTSFQSRYHALHSLNMRLAELLKNL